MIWGPGDGFLHQCSLTGHRTIQLIQPLTLSKGKYNDTGVILKRSSQEMNWALGDTPIHTCSVADPHHFDANSDPACHFDPDPDPARAFYADPDPYPTFSFDVDPDPDPSF